MILDQLGLLSEMTRVRILRLVANEELGVGEIAQILQLPQSTVSRHLKVLDTHGYLTRRQVGTSSMVRFVVDDLDAAREALWTLVVSETADDPSVTQDFNRMKGILSQRQLDSRAFFGQVASRWGEVRAELFGTLFTTSALVALLPDDWVVADLGCGSGEVSAQLAPSVRHVIGVDHEQAMLDAAEDRLSGVENVSLRLGELSALPLRDEEADAALLMLVLHHVDDLVAAMTEVNRILKPGGRCAVIDMVQHGRDDYRHRMGHVHMGFTEAQIKTICRSAGLRLTRFSMVPADPSAQGPGLFVATLIKVSAM